MSWPWPCVRIRTVIEVSEDGLTWEATGVEGVHDCHDVGPDIPKRLFRGHNYVRQSTYMLDGSFIEHNWLKPLTMD